MTKAVIRYKLLKAYMARGFYNPLDALGDVVGVYSPSDPMSDKIEKEHKSLLKSKTYDKFDVGVKLLLEKHSK